MPNSSEIYCKLGLISEFGSVTNGAFSDFFPLRCLSEVMSLIVLVLVRSSTDDCVVTLELLGLLIVSDSLTCCIDSFSWVYLENILFSLVSSWALW